VKVAATRLNDTFPSIIARNNKERKPHPQANLELYYHSTLQIEIQLPKCHATRVLESPHLLFVLLYGAYFM